MWKRKAYISYVCILFSILKYTWSSVFVYGCFNVHVYVNGQICQIGLYSRHIVRWSCTFIHVFKSKCQFLSFYFTFQILNFGHPHTLWRNSSGTCVLNFTTRAWSLWYFQNLKLAHKLRLLSVYIYLYDSF